MVEVGKTTRKRSGPKPRDPAARFWEKVVKDGHGCWLWVGAMMPNGYGYFTIDGKPAYSHRVAFEWAKGAIPAGLQIDHLCRNRACVNPDHLEAVTAQVNLLRGNHPNMVAHRENRCCKGHELTPENSGTRRRGSGATRIKCKRCHRERAVIWRKRRKEVSDVG